MRYGYVRVSSRDQNEDRQILAMQEAAVDRGCIFLDKQSGKDFDRPQYQALLRLLRKGDTLVIKSIDRLGRNYDGILEQWRELSNRGVGIVVLDMPILDTSKDRDLTGRLISDIVLQLLSYVAQTEREFIKQRQAEGIAAAKARGVHFGRVAQPLPKGFKSISLDYQAQKMTSRRAAELLGTSHTTFLRWVKQFPQEDLNEQGDRIPGTDGGAGDLG